MIGSIGSLRDARHIDKTFYLGVDERFYELNYPHYEPTRELVEIVEALIEADEPLWDLRRSDVWTHVMPNEKNEAATELLRQGWKIHVSATNLNCKDVLKRVADLAIQRCIQFKFANDTETLRMMTSKRWPRGGSGKFITVYPSTETIFRDFLDVAYSELAAYSGSYILSDRRYKDSKCLYYRYGGVQSTSRLDWLGRRLEFLTSPDGEEVFDRRRPFFEAPSWVSDPFPSEEEDGAEMTLDQGRYTVKSALSFSNTGGVYLATDNHTSVQVVIKEARPGVELGRNGEDAISRLAQEAKMLGVAETTGVVPLVMRTFSDWENFYLVEEYLEADDMRGIMLEHTPLLRVNPTKEFSEEFYFIFRNLFLGLLDATRLLHESNVVIGDLSPTNIMVERTSKKVRIIDLEGAFRPLIDGAQDIHTPGFRADTAGRAKESNFSDDLYAVGVIMMYAMFPIAAMAYVRKDLFANVLPVLVADIGWQDTPVVDLVRRLTNNAITCKEAIAMLEQDVVIHSPDFSFKGTMSDVDLTETCAGLARFITQNYRLDTLYSLFPIDPFGQLSNPMGLFFGSTGILHTLLATGFAPPQEALDRYRRELDALDVALLPPGLLIGTSGMSWGLLGIGHAEEGLRLLDQANADPLTFEHHSLFYGMAGVGMVNLSAYHSFGDECHLAMAIKLAEALSNSSISDYRGVHWEHEGDIGIGYGYGQSGVALFLLRLSQTLNDPRWRQLGQSALEYDLSFGVETEPGIISFGDAPGRTETLEQYIEQGSGGIAKVAIRYGLWDRVDNLLADMHRKYSCFAGLIYGLSGFVDVLIDAYRYSGDAKYLNMADRPLRGIFDLYLFKTQEGLAAPGENLFRISCDHATGLAGILYTLHRRLHLCADEFCLDVLDDLKVV